MARLAAACLALACLCSAGFAAASQTPITIWGSARFLAASGTESKAVPAAQALEELFSAVAGLEGRPAEQALAGVLDVQKLTDAVHNSGGPLVDAVVVLASGAEAAPQAVQHRVEQMAEAAADSLALPNAQHESSSHPVFAGLRTAAPRLAVTVLGDCGGAFVPAAAPATAQALRQQLAKARAGASSASLPAVIVVCPSAEEDVDGSAEVALLEAAQLSLGELAPRHFLLHVVHPPSAREQRRRLAEAREANGGAKASRLAAMGGALPAEHAALLLSRGDAANRTQNYTVCDPECQKHVMWFQGIIVFIVILTALLIGCCCMHMVDVPTRFAQPEQSRQHHD